MMVIATSSRGVLCGVVVVWLASSALCEQNTSSGIFRHQVLPFLGGKIPESAFSPERLYTNLLNKNGVHTDDGIYFQEKHPVRHNYPRAFMPNIIKINIPANNKYVAKPGRDYNPITIDTTYLISDVVEDVIRPNPSSFQDLPLIPKHSLKLSYKERLKKSRSDSESVQIFRRYLPLLKQMPEVYN